MKLSSIFLIVFFFSFFSYGQKNPIERLTFEVLPMYGYHSDSTPGRIVHVTFPNESKTDQLTFFLKNKESKNRLESLMISDSSCQILLPEGLGLNKDTKIELEISSSKIKGKKSLLVPKMRYWEIFLYHHTHVDIGYSNTQENVESILKTNILEGIRLGVQQQNSFPKLSRNIWNSEIGWPLERLWKSNPEKRDSIILGLKKEYIGLGASYVNFNTSLGVNEALFNSLFFGRKIEKISGKPTGVFYQVDIPGITWGLVPVLNQMGINYIMSWPNTYVSGNTHRLDQKPFWWIGPDKKSKVLFFQPGMYSNGGSMEKGRALGRPWFGERDYNKIPKIINTGEANVDFTKMLLELEEQEYEYDFLALSWSLWDNSIIDADVSVSVKRWNEKYAYPRIRMSNGYDIMKYIDDKYGKYLPSRSGDFSEYWTDGLGSLPRYSKILRNVQEKLIQTENLWTMINSDNLVPRARLDQAWRDILIGLEHTWGSENLSEPFFEETIFSKKASFIRKTRRTVDYLFNEAFDVISDKSSGGFDPPGGPSNGGCAVFNTNSKTMSGPVILSKAESQWGDLVKDDMGNIVPSQRLKSGELSFWASEVAPFSSKYFTISKDDHPGIKESDIIVSDSSLENKFLRIIINKENGNLKSIINLSSGEEYLKGESNTFNRIVVNEDIVKKDSLIEIKILSDGPLIGELEVYSKADGLHFLKRKIRLLSDAPWFEIENQMDKIPNLEKEEIHFGFNFNIDQSMIQYDVPNAVVNLEKDVWKEGNHNWITFQRWLNITNNRKGVVFVSPDAPLLQFGDFTANKTAKGHRDSGWMDSIKISPLIYSYVINNIWGTNFRLSTEGRLSFRYKIYPTGNSSTASINKFAKEQTQPLVHLMVKEDPATKPLIKIENDDIFIDIIKRIGLKKVLIRVRSFATDKQRIKFETPLIKPVKITELINGEEVEKDLSNIQIMPNQISTFELEF